VHLRRQIMLGELKEGDPLCTRQLFRIAAIWLTSLPGWVPTCWPGTGEVQQEIIRMLASV
jgi:hypothetical protein